MRGFVISKCRWALHSSDGQSTSKVGKGNFINSSGCSRQVFKFPRISTLTDSVDYKGLLLIGFMGYLFDSIFVGYK